MVLLVNNNAVWLVIAALRILTSPVFDQSRNIGATQTSQFAITRNQAKV